MKDQRKTETQRMEELQQSRQRLAELLQIDENQVNVKAKSGEQVGPVGREEAISADAIVLLTRD